MDDEMTLDESAGGKPLIHFVKTPPRPHYIVVTQEELNSGIALTVKVECPGVDVGDCEAYARCTVPECVEQFAEWEGTGPNTWRAHGEEHAVIEDFEDAPGVRCGECFVVSLVAHNSDIASWLMFAYQNRVYYGPGTYLLEFDGEQAILKRRVYDHERAVQ